MADTTIQVNVNKMGRNGVHLLCKVRRKGADRWRYDCDMKHQGLTDDQADAMYKVFMEFKAGAESLDLDTKEGAAAYLSLCAAKIGASFEAIET